MPQYLSPGVYVEEIPSAVQAIAGVSTSTAGFIGQAPDVVVIPPGPLYRVMGEPIEPQGKKADVAAFPVSETGFVVNELWTENNTAKSKPVDGVTLKNDFTTGKATLAFPADPVQDHTYSVDYDTFAIPVKAEAIGKGDTKTLDFRLASYPVRTDSFTINLAGQPAANVKLVNDFVKRASYVHFDAAPAMPRRRLSRWWATLCGRERACHPSTPRPRMTTARQQLLLTRKSPLTATRKSFR